jgi:hypothetical protein
MTVRQLLDQMKVDNRLKGKGTCELYVISSDKLGIEIQPLDKLISSLTSSGAIRVHEQKEGCVVAEGTSLRPMTPTGLVGRMNCSPLPRGLDNAFKTKVAAFLGYSPRELAFYDKNHAPVRTGMFPKDGVVYAVK